MDILNIFITKKYKESMSKDVTVILTSCGRFDLLRITIESFLLHNTYPIKEFIIYEDSGLGVPKDIANDFKFVRWIAPQYRHGQVTALDMLWSQVKTEYAMCLEDDWETIKGGFIEDSMAILEADEKVLQVWLKPLEEHNVHPREGTTSKKLSFIYLTFRTSGNLWSGTNFSPSLKRKSDYDLIGSYGKHTTFNPAKAWKSEADIAKLYHSLGFKGAIFSEPYIKHLGENRRVI